MWKPATFAVESFVSWFVNKMLIKPGPDQVSRQEIEAWFENFPKNDPQSYFLPDRPFLPVPRDWLKEESKHGDATLADFAFPSDIETGSQRNDTVRGKAILHPSRAQGPAVIMLHGWLTPGHHQSMSVAKDLVQQGYSTYMLELPQHMRRRPKGKFSGSTFINPDLRKFYGAIQQSVSDVHKLIQLLQRKGHRQIHLMGISFGAYISTIVSSCPPDPRRIQSLTLVMPVVDLSYTFANSPILSKGRELLEHHDITMDELSELFAPLKTSNYRPLLPRERILLVNASHDRVSYAHKVRELWKEWNYPHLFEEPQGHVSMIFAREPFRRIVSHLGQYTQSHGYLSDTNPHPQTVLL
ncbi:MAG: alpha/beta fold hydrolase [Deltaproteobacteria bacterium]|nr:MAG: alpha/beta fold hydrolase [Deltaproteobacteria bacterium]